MATRQRRKSFYRRLILPAVTTAFLCYFGYHAFHGDYGLFARARLDHEAERLTADLAALQERRHLLEQRVALLRPESLDPDMIDEYARRNLNMVHANEVAILRRKVGQ